MLFSEPKIPQFDLSDNLRRAVDCFSALQRAENSSIGAVRGSAGTRPDVSVLFSEPKIPQSASPSRPPPSSTAFQCSSASRKFLNRDRRASRDDQRDAFQCSSASRKFLNMNFWSGRTFPNPMFQCSSASRKFLNQKQPRRSDARACVSVLFSEPKIPQSTCKKRCDARSIGFSALQRAENSSIRRVGRVRVDFRRRFSALQRAENSSMSSTPSASARCCWVSVLFSEPKIPQ